MQVLEIPKPNKLPLKVKAGYGAAAGAEFLILTLFMTFGMYFLTDVVGLSPVFAGTIIAVGTLWDAIMDPLVGLWSDNVDSRHGRRRPFLFFDAIPFSVIAWLLFTNFDLSPFMTKVYFLVMVVLYYSSYALFQIPYASLAAEMTQDYDERMSLITWRTFIGEIGTIVGAAAPLMLVVFYDNIFGSLNMGWSMMAGTFGLISIPLILTTWHMSKGYELFTEQMNVDVRDILESFKNRPLRYVILIFVPATIALSFSVSVFVYFFTYIMGYDETEISIANMVFWVPALFWIPVVNITAQKLSKHIAWVIFGSLGVIVSVIGFQFLVQPGKDIVLYAVLFFESAWLMAVFQIPWALLPDCLEVEEYKTGKRKEGVFNGVAAFIQKVAMALAIQLTGIILTLVGYKAGIPQTESTLSGIRAMLGVGLPAFLLISITIALFMPLTRQKHAAIREAIKLKSEGKQVDEEPFHDLL